MAKQDRKRINRAIALAASVVLAVGLVPVPAIAVGTGDELGGQPLRHPLRQPHQTRSR